MVYIQVFYNVVHRESCIFVDVSILTVPLFIYLLGFLFFCFILQQEYFTSGMKSYEVELWNSFSFSKTKVYS